MRLNGTARGQLTSTVKAALRGFPLRREHYREAVEVAIALLRDVDPKNRRAALDAIVQMGKFNVVAWDLEKDAKAGRINTITVTYEEPKELPAGRAA